MTVSDFEQTDPEKFRVTFAFQFYEATFDCSLTTLVRF